MSQIIHSLDQVLEQGETLLLGLDDDLYRTSARCNNGTIGAHYRHCLDHFERLFNGLGVGLIDYDARHRDQRIEHDRGAALVRTHEFRKEALSLGAENLTHSIRIRCAISPDAENSPNVTSSIQREIMFCISHAIHHYAIIGMICRSMDIRLPDEFGVAPSTLKYRQSTARVAA